MAKTVETIPVARPVGRAWLRIFGPVPCHFDQYFGEPW